MVDLLFFEMINNGASIIDIGGESSRPGAEKVSIVEEKNRVIDPIKHLKNCKGASLLSLDSRNLSTMKTCHKIGVDIFNDISALNDRNKIEFISKNKNIIIILNGIKKSSLYYINNLPCSYRSYCLYKT